MEFRAAHRSERDAVLELLSLWYNEHEFFARYNRNDPSFRDDLCLVAVDRGAIVSTVQIFDRAVNFVSQTVPLGGIGSVFTREDYRHKGVASALMKLSLDTMAREGFELSLLFAERLTFYQQFGWESIPRKFTLLANAAAARASGDYTIDIFQADRDLAEIVELHRHYSGRFNATAVRSADCWRGNLVYAASEPLQPCREYFTVCRDGAGSIRAYARACRLFKLPMVMEFGYRDADTRAMLALMRFLGECVVAAPHACATRGDHRNADVLRVESSPAGSGALVTQLAHDPALEHALKTAGVTVLHHSDTGPMWRVVEPQALGRRFGMESRSAVAHIRELVACDSCVFWTADRF